MNQTADLPAASDAYFRTLLEALPDAMIIVDNGGGIVIVNGQAERMFGYTRDELVGQRIECLLPERLRQRHVGHRESFVDDPKLRPMGAGQELIARRKDGGEFAVEISLSPVSVGDGTYTSSIIRDVSRRKEMEKEIIEARQAAERANKANSAFLAAASHDLRQPVQALSLLNGALRRTVTDERALKMIDSQQASLTAMTNLLNSLLDISRLDAGAITPEIEEFPMQRLIDRLGAEFTRQARHKGLSFEAVGCEALVKSDANLLAEILQNLVSNAIRYTEQGDVRVVCDEEGDCCRLRVIDTGIGIEADQIDEIFREFHQVQPRGAAKEGFGLGLAIVRRLADLLEHGIEVRSTPGQGSEFSVTVPIVADRRATLHESVLESGEHAAGSVSGTVILIEDDASVADAWAMLLDAEGYHVEMAASAAEAMDVVRRIDAAPDLIISDYHLLDDSTGVEAVSAIRKHFDQQIPAFVVSGDTSKVVSDARLLENCTLLSKPIDTNWLLAAAAIAARTGAVPED